MTTIRDLAAPAQMPAGMQAIVYLAQVTIAPPITHYAFRWADDEAPPYSIGLSSDLFYDKEIPVAEEALDRFAIARDTLLASLCDGLDAREWRNGLPDRETFLRHVAEVHYMLDAHGMRVEDCYEQLVEVTGRIGAAEFSLILHRLPLVPLSPKVKISAGKSAM